jgi:hypothetical protein
MGLHGLSIVREKGFTRLGCVAPKPDPDKLEQRLLGRLGEREHDLADIHLAPSRVPQRDLLLSIGKIIAPSLQDDLSVADVETGALFIHKPPTDGLIVIRLLESFIAEISVPQGCRQRLDLERQRLLGRRSTPPSRDVN